MEQIAKNICLFNKCCKILTCDQNNFAQKIGLCDGAIKNYLENKKNNNMLIIESKYFDNFINSVLLTFFSFCVFENQNSLRPSKKNDFINLID